MATSPSRFLITERPFYSIDGVPFFLDDEDGPSAPREGDVVRALSEFPDEDGDLDVVWGGQTYSIARVALVDVTTVLALVRSQGAA